MVVTAHGAMLPSPHGGTLHPTFWVTVENSREGRIAVTPTDARLVDVGRPAARRLAEMAAIPTTTMLTDWDVSFRPKTVTGKIRGVELEQRA